MDFSTLTDSDRVHIQAHLEQQQLKDMTRGFASLVDRCFSDCVNDFTTKVLSGREELCVNRCIDKFMNYSKRVGLRFAENNAIQQQMQQ
ncbi:putative TIM9-translocase of the mitochondrial inner membrane [Cladochytrium replicatum]|nr:putative TIM9-translocase of the mitochondrial inner membrane [Cladochytrium replicatum]